MGINVYIAEDNLMQRANLEKYITDYQLFSDWEMKLCYSTGNGAELLAHVDRENRWNIYFLDISLEKGDEFENGLMLAQEIRRFDPLGFIVFITAKSELSFITFQYHVQALDFIIKDATIDVRERVHSCLKTVEQRLEKLDVQKSIKLNTGNEINTFILDDILYFSSSKGHIITLHTRQSKYDLHQETLNSLEFHLQEDFIRCHRGFLINRNMVMRVPKDFNSVVLKDGSVIPVSVRKKRQIKELYEDENSSIRKLVKERKELFQ